ncbi:MAG: hypothetical protein GKR96_05055 [Gammaproteobacteria bacterium]|nr:hypothetical protein [Gammaproteobacteria bacterium]
MSTSLSILACSVFAGLLFPELAAWWGDFMFGSLFCIMLFALMQIDLLTIKEKVFANMELVIAMVAVQMIALPIVIFILIELFSWHSAAAQYALLVACAGSVFGTPAFAGLLGLDRTQSLLGVIATTLLVPLTTLIVLPLVTHVSDQGVVVFDLSVYVSRIGMFIVLPMTLAVIYRKFLRLTGSAGHDRLLRIAVVITLVIFAVAVMDGVTAKWIEDPVSVVELFIWVMIIHVSLYLISYLCFRAHGMQAAITAGMLSAYRNLGLVVAICGPFLSDEFLIFVGLWQIPMYVSPLCLRLIFGDRYQR